MRSRMNEKKKVGVRIDDFKIRIKINWYKIPQENLI